MSREEGDETRYEESRQEEPVLARSPLAVTDLTPADTGTRCRSCKTRVFFSVNSGTGKRAILDLEPHPTKGNVLRHSTPTGPKHRVLRKEEIARYRNEGVPLYVDHHFTCPEADQWRKEKRK